MTLRIGDIETVASVRFDDEGADRYDRRTRAMRADAKRGIVTEAKLDVDKHGFDTYERQVRGADRAQGDFVRGSGRLRSGLGSLFVGGAGVAAGAIAFGALAKGVLSSNAAFEESQKVGAQTTAVIKSTGGAANVTADEIGDLATQISRKTAIDDEAIQSGANMLLTFTNVRNETGKGNDVFNQATKTLVDMSTALGTDASQSAIQLGKALNDPIKGVSALSRVGVTFTAQQKDQIKTLVDSGRTVDAQRIILKELNKEFGGSAAAQATATDRMKVSLGNLAESVGGVVNPLISRAADGIAKFADEMVDGEGAGGRFVEIARDVADAAKDIASGAEDAIDWVRDLFSGGENVGQLGAAFASARAYALELWETIKSTTRGIGEAFDGVQPDLEIIGAFLRDTLGVALMWVWNIARRALPGIGALITGLAVVVRGVIDVIAGILTLDFGRIWDGVKRIVSGAVRALGGAIRALSAPFREVFADIGHVISAGVNDAIDYVSRLPGRIVTYLDTTSRRFRRWASDIASDAATAGRRLVSSLIDRAEALPGQLADVGRRALRRVAGWVDGFGDAAGDVGRGVVHALIDGVTSLPGAIAAAGRGIGRSLLNAVKSFLGINSPSKAFEEVGLNMVQGLARGIDKGDVVALAKKAFGGIPKLAVQLIKRGVIKASSLPGTAIDKLGDLGGGILDALGITTGGGAGGPAPKGSADTAAIWSYLAGKFGLRKSSGYRSPAHNAAVGGVPNSYHTHGSPSHPGAIDLVGSLPAMRAASAFARRFHPIENLIHDVGSGLHLHLAFFRRGGVAGPGSPTGKPAVVYGEGNAREWWISQEGDKRQNVGWGVEALEALTGRRVAFMRSGGTLGHATAAVAKGERGITNADNHIQRLEREYGQADRRFNITQEEFITENADGVAMLDKDAIAKRAAELDDLHDRRKEIRRWLRILRDRVDRLVAVMRTTIARLNRAARTGKKERREHYKEMASEMSGRRDALVDRRRTMDLDIKDATIDLEELAAERASVMGTDAPPPAADDTSVAPAAATDPGPAAAPVDTPTAAQPTAAQIAAAAAAQFAAFSAAREDLFTTFGGNFAARGSTPFATSTGQAAGVAHFGATGARAYAAAGGQITYVENATFANSFPTTPPDGGSYVQQQERELTASFS